jgi:hypothetical protein
MRSGKPWPGEAESGDADLSCGEVLRGSVVQLVDLHAGRFDGVVGGGERLLAHALRLRCVEAPGVVAGLGGIAGEPHGGRGRRRGAAGRARWACNEALVVSLDSPSRAPLRYFGRLSRLACFSSPPLVPSSLSPVHQPHF